MHARREPWNKAWSVCMRGTSEGERVIEGDKATAKTHIVSAEDTNDLAVAVDLAEDPLLHVLEGIVSKGTGRGTSRD